MLLGIETVVDWDQCWISQEVCRCLDVDLRGQTSASFNMRQNYERCLFEFEDYLATGVYVADVNAGRAPSADAILPFQPRHPIASVPPASGIAPARHTPSVAPRAATPQERTVTTRGALPLFLCISPAPFMDMRRRELLDCASPIIAHSGAAAQLASGAGLFGVCSFVYSEGVLWSVGG